MPEQVVPYDTGVQWDPNAPDAVLVQSDGGNAALALNAHPDDEDRRTVVLAWTGCVAALMSPPNDEVIHRHRLYLCGLREILWAGVVQESRWAASFEPMQARPPEKHFVVLTKEATVEVLALRVSVLRAAGSTAEAAASFASGRTS